MNGIRDNHCLPSDIMLLMVMMMVMRVNEKYG